MFLSVENTGSIVKHGLVQLPQLLGKPKNLMDRDDKAPGLLWRENGIEEELKLITRCDDLSAVRSIELILDTRKSHFIDLGAQLPFLRHLKLANSFVPAIKDLGSPLRNLQILYMPRCSLKDLDCISCMPCITELYLAFNAIEDLTPCASLEQLEILDIEGNSIKAKEDIVPLKFCKQLCTLSLLGNPLVDSCGGVKAYRKFVKKTLTKLTVLDDQPIGNSKSRKSPITDIARFENEWEYINEVLREIGLVSDKTVTSENCSDNSNLCHRAEITSTPIPPGRCGRGLRPATVKLPTVDCPNLSEANKQDFTFPDSIDSRPASTVSVVVDGEEKPEADETASILTTGHIICGGISKALRARRGTNKLVKSSDSQKFGSNKQSTNGASTLSTLKLLKEKFKNKNSSRSPVSPQFSTNIIQEPDPVQLSIQKQENELKQQCTEVFEELAAWRKKNSRNRKLFYSTKREFSRATADAAEAEGDLRLVSTESVCTLDDRAPSSLDVGLEANAEEGLPKPNPALTGTGDASLLAGEPSDILPRNPGATTSTNPETSPPGDSIIIDSMPDDSASKWRESLASQKVDTAERNNQMHCHNLNTHMKNSERQLPKIALARTRSEGIQPKFNVLPKPTVVNSSASSSGNALSSSMANPAKAKIATSAKSSSICTSQSNPTQSSTVGKKLSGSVVSEPRIRHRQ